MNLVIFRLCFKNLPYERGTVLFTLKICHMNVVSFVLLPNVRFLVQLLTVK